MKSDLKKGCIARLAALREIRQSWWMHWAELATYMLPRRYIWLVEPNKLTRGSPINNSILDSTATVAARTLASGMMSGVTSPTRPWFKLRIDGSSPDDMAVNVWLAECERRMMRVFQESNFYTSMATMYMDLVVFGTAVCIIYDDFEDVIRCYSPCLGEFYLANDFSGRVDTIYREFVMSVDQLASRFGVENLSDSDRLAYSRGSGEGKSERKVYHGLEPNVGPSSLPPKFKFREVYWYENSDDTVLSVQGFVEWPALAPRWDVSSNDAYGRSPAMDALGDTKQLQQETKRKAQAIDLMVRPPLMADIQLKNQPASVLPGGVTYVSNLRDNAGMKPIYSVMPPIAEIKQDIEEVQGRIKLIFFNDLFRMISDLQTVRTATEIDARREEKLVMLGPVLERFQNEALDPAIDRVFGIMTRQKLFPPAPESIKGGYISVQYVSMLAEAQNAVATGSMERFVAFLGSQAALDPEVLDNYDADEGADEYASRLALPPKLIRAPKDVAAIRAKRAQQQQATTAAAATPGLAQAGKNLADTRVGNGQSALDAILGNPQSGGGQ